MKALTTAAFCMALALAGCTTLPPLSDQLTLVPASGADDATPGLDLTYLYGTNEGLLSHVSCDQVQRCWFSGILGKFKTNATRINSLVIRTIGTSHIAWAHTYQVNDTYTDTNGLVPTPDGGALLYGNTFISHFSGEQPEPVYEKLDASGNPQWGGALPIGRFAPWSAFSDAIRTRDGGYVLAGSGYVKKHYWYGVLLKIDASGAMEWVESVHSRDEPTFINGIVQLPGGDILAVGVNAKLSDIVLFRFSPDGKFQGSSILDIRGSEVPIGLVSVPDGVDVAVSQTMPSGEEAAIVMYLDRNGRLNDAARYHSIDGFLPKSVVALTPRTVCLYGVTTANDNAQSIAIALDANRLPVSALVMKGVQVFNSATLYESGTIIFAGNRALGTDERMTPLITRWAPGVDNDPQVLKVVQRDTLEITVHSGAEATVSQWGKPKLKFLQPDELPFQSIYGSSESTSP